MHGTHDAVPGQDQDPSDETIAEAPRIWFHHLRDNLLQVGFEQMIDVDPCLFISAKVICAACVDDCIMVVRETADIDVVTKDLRDL